jgi:putative ABC transport system ATP-binding protein
MSIEAFGGGPMIHVDNVTKTYRQGRTGVRALDGLSLCIERGEFVAVMGPSGSGKSTLLHLIGGLDVPDSGEILVGGERLSDLSDYELTLFRRRRVGFVFQFFNLLPTLTAEENVALPLLLDRKPTREMQQRVGEMLELVGLAERRHHRPDALSGGEMQRVAIARALVVEPILVLADEPTGNLDSRTGDDILQLITESSRERQQTVILVTHDARAAAHANRIVTLCDGSVVDELVDRSVVKASVP